MTTTFAGPGRFAALRAEHTKFVTVRSLPGLALTALIAAGVLALLFCVSLPITQGIPLAAAAPATVVEAALLGIDVAALVLIVAGASFAGSEYATGLAQPTFILTPRRERVLLAKASVTAAVAAGVAAVAAVACVLVGQAVLLTGGHPTAEVGADLARLAAGSALGPVFYVVVALAVASLTRSTGGGIVGALGLLALPTIAGWIPPATAMVPLLPAAALHSISGAAGPAEQLPVLGAVASLLVWTAALLGAAVLRVRSRDA